MGIKKLMLTFAITRKKILAKVLKFKLTTGQFRVFLI